MDYYEPHSGLFIADPEQDLWPDGLPSFDELTESARSLILSASGWRKVFAADGDEESLTTQVKGADKMIAAAAALSFVEQMLRLHDRQLLIWVGCDSRPTGSVLMDVMLRVFIARDVKVKASFITAAPELMAAVKLDEEAHGFAYISASHNPVGHNGIKFGGANGAVLGGSSSAELITHFETALKEPLIIKKLSRICLQADTAKYQAVLQAVPQNKQNALQTYTRFTRQVVSGSNEPEGQSAFFDDLAASLDRTPIGIIGELNGSARSTSIDRELLQESGFTVEMHNDTPRQIVHSIVPEGAGLDPCRKLLALAHAKNPAFTLGYVPDNDGDRGNLVYIGVHGQQPQRIAAQELFALVVLAELSYQHQMQNQLQEDSLNAGGPSKEPFPQAKAVVVNGPTSMRIERIAKAFAAEVWRAEVGEANVVSLAEQLRAEGYQVRILGEGSNGGNITHPSTVRDPLSTIFSISRLLAFRGKNSSFNPYAQWCQSPESSAAYSPDFNLGQIIASLPPFVTTNAYEAEAKMRISTYDHAALKRRWEYVFLQEWEQHKDFLRTEYGIVSWREVNYEGTQARTGFGPDYRSGSEKGGLKIIFSNAAGEDTDFIWMRGSGTEPVFRVLADSNGNDHQRHDWLLQWHRTMIETADGIQ